VKRDLFHVGKEVGREIGVGGEVKKETETHAYVSLDLHLKFSQMLDNRGFDCPAEISVLVSDSACLVADSVIHILVQANR